MAALTRVNPDISQREVKKLPLLRRMEERAVERRDAV